MDVQLTVLAVLWLPVLIIPLVTHVSPGLSDTLDIIDYRLDRIESLLDQRLPPAH